MRLWRSLFLLLLSLSWNVLPARAQEPVLSFDDIVVGDWTITPAPDGLSALVRVTTLIDAACEVVYGETDFSRSATDVDMGASGFHTQHTPILTSLQPDTEYIYRFQGTDANGVQYQSPTYRFRTPLATGPVALGPNVARGARIVEVSSEYSPAYAATRAVDGDLTTEWSSNGDGDRAFITIDLGRPVEVIGVGFRTRTMTDGSSEATSFSATVDGTTTYGPFSAGQGLAVAPVTFTGQIIRFNVVTSTGGNTGALEVEVYTP
jgi:hypothetical protein